MSNPTPAKLFLNELEAKLKAGNATEHTYRSALEALFNSVLAPAVATNEPKHEAYGAPDFIIQQGHTPLGQVEAKDVNKVDFDKVIADSEREKPSTDNGKQLRRYRAALPNLLYTDGLCWHWFVNGEQRTEEAVCVATWNKSKKKLIISAEGEATLTTLLQQFASQQAATINTPHDLARRLAQVARWLCDVIRDVFGEEQQHGSLHQQLVAFQQTLLPALKPDEFADMYAQTIVYGLFAARATSPDKPGFTRYDAAHLIPKTNPFLRKLFQEVAGYDLDERIAWLVDDCAALLARTDMGAVLQDFGKATMQQDPVVHFYETFLAAYDPKMRETRGVYYTPEPVVSFIVRAVDALLRSRFGKHLGLADEQTMILDPATGTATFLHAVVQQIQATLAAQGMAGVWNSYVPQKLLPRLFGFELLMAPYTVAHLKLGLLLQQLGYTFGSNERLGIYLTNALADTPPNLSLPGFGRFIAEEGEAADKVKHEKPVMVVLGNPPYSYESTNTEEWISKLVRDYYKVDGKPLGEKNPKGLQDDYVKFIRFGQWRIGETGEGILAFISNNGYLDNPTFRGMRQSLLNEFDTIYILNLHGNSKKKERTPDGGPDENVFDIQQGVAIGLFVKHGGEATTPATVYYTDLWGERTGKYESLLAQDVVSSTWQQLKPTTPWYLFVSQNTNLSAEYEPGWNVTTGMPINSVGLYTARDDLAIQWTKDDLYRVMSDFAALESEVARARYELGSDSRDWQVVLAQKDVRASHLTDIVIQPISYRPFDTRYTLYTGISRGIICMPRPEVMRHFANKGNLGLCFIRRSRDNTLSAFYVAAHLVDKSIVSSLDNANVAPLYLYPTLQEVASGLYAADERRPNLSEAFIKDITQRLELAFVQDGKGDLTTTLGPEDIFHYIYAIFHSPTYRSRYAEFLKIDFPRVPLTSDRELFSALVAKGAELVDLHLLRLPSTSGVGGAGGAAGLVNVGQQGVTFPHDGSNLVEKVQYVAPQGSEPGRVVFNSTQYVAGIEPATWSMQIGGYQPLEKWLKDRKGRTLTYDDIQHYMRVVVALRETRRIMAEIDAVIPGWPLE